MKKLLTATGFLVLASLILVACGAPATEAPAPTEAPATEAPATEPVASDLLATIQARGTIVGFTDPAYPPQSSLKAEPKRTDGTKCAAEEKTLGELEGFDIDVTAAIAEKLGVEACFVTPAWDMLVAGGWSDRWDFAIGSITVTPDRAKVLYFGQPYYTTPAALFVHADNTTLTQASDLSGKKVGVCSGCTYEQYLTKTLEIPGVTMDYVIDDADVKGYDTDTTALQDLALGDGVRLDAVLTAQPTGAQFMADGQPVKQLGEPVYFEYLAPGFDRSASLDNTSLIAAVNEIIQGLHADGTLLEISTTYYGLDLTTAAGDFDLSLLPK